ncbi:inosine/xanthosine triphosphatase [Oceanisphaera sp. IT1-181]|uniref:inosine/xanthosine triphosphatase n=1 Tax=Oceanisphaera sp. IT1-181 TaxID=3081199 RepID=UPI0029C9F018|nr:inosine/xanthosine triphosphatase [Oceanisphaera sp. IT1-181]
MLQVIVASLSPAKIEAARLALAQLLPESPLVVTGVAVKSGVAEQPMSDTETYQGARQRAFAAKTLLPEADLWIGMEGGVEFSDLQLNPHHCITFAWIQVLGQALDNASRSASLTLPPKVAQALANGEALGPAMDRLFRQSHNRPTGGAIGILTQQHLTRRTVYRDTLILALTPWLNPQLYR